MFVQLFYKTEHFMKQPFILFLLLCTAGIRAQSDNQWPREIPLKDGGKVVIYQPQPESYTGNKVASRAAIQVKKTAKEEPIFGAVWTEATMLTNRDTRMMSLESIVVKDVRFPDVQDETQIEQLKVLIETEVPKWDIEISLDKLLASLEQDSKGSSDGLNMDPPKIIYAQKPTTLVLIDGEPEIKKDDEMKMERVMNTPFLIVKNSGTFYLYAGGFWFQSAQIMSGWANINKLPKEIKKLDESIKKQEKEDNQDEQPKDLPKKPTEIVVSTQQAEIFQTDGEAQFNNVEGSSLLYVSNTDNDIFKDINTQKNYVLLSGRWYSGPSLDGPWTYVPADKLPEDFSKIPEGSEKDAVLASVAGTQAANEAVLDAQIPQTAKVDRKTASTTVTYDGQPKFEPIQGTNLYLAVNSPQTVMRANNRYYTVDNGVWFVSDNAAGPWSVSDERPADVDKIPASSAAYNTKYVYIYERTPEYVYVGYTPAYMGSYIYGPTIVYGTGWYYRPWWGSYYYPRPWTWGWGVSYNPWYGWSFGWRYQWNFSWHVSYGYGWHGGYWGPPMYRPPYRPGGWHGGYYGPRPGGPSYGGRPTVNRPRPVNNIYNKRPGVISKEPRPSYRPSKPGTNGRVPATKPGTPAGGRQPGTTPSKPATRPATKPSKEPNNVITDKRGDVYQRDPNGNWNQRQDKSWKPAPSNSREQLNRTQQQRDRGNTRQNNFNKGQQTKTAPRTMPSKAGGSRRRG